MPTAVVPVKSMSLAKSRLAGVLDAAGRRALAEQMLTHVIGILREAGLSSIRIATGDRDLNADATSAARLAEADGAVDLLLVMADLPYLSSQDIAAMIEAGRQSPVVIAEAKDGGTNALLLRPPTAIEFAFSTETPSAALHAERATAAGFAPRLVRRPGLARDIDTPADLAALASDHAAYRVFRHVA
jgi:2-phospho-L-lactate guanylyltransferase